MEDHTFSLRARIYIGIYMHNSITFLVITKYHDVINASSSLTFDTINLCLHYLHTMHVSTFSMQSAKNSCQLCSY